MTALDHILASPRRSPLAAAATLAAAGRLLLLAPVARAQMPPGSTPTAIQDALFEAQTDILLDGGASAAAAVTSAEAAVSGALERQPADLLAGACSRSARRPGGDADRPPPRGDEVALAAARGPRPGGASPRRLRRRRRRARRPGSPSAPGLAADPGFPPGHAVHPARRRRHRRARQLEQGEIAADEAVTGVRKDLLDAYQARLVSYLDEAEQAAERGFDSAFAENAALAAGYWRDHRARVRGQQRSPAERQGELDADFAGLAAAAARGRSPRLPRSRDTGPRPRSTASPQRRSRPRSRSGAPTSSPASSTWSRSSTTAAPTTARSRSPSRSRRRSRSPRRRARPSPTSSRPCRARPRGRRHRAAALDELDRITADANEGGAVAPARGGRARAR